MSLASCSSETAEESSDDDITIDVDDSLSEKLEKLKFPEEFQLPEVVIGRESAPITVIIYSSFTCNHCRVFHQVELPKFKKRYVDTGKVKIYLRCYLDDMAAFEAATLTRGLGKDSLSKITAAYDAIFLKQQEWSESEDQPEFLKKIFEAKGYSRKDIDACLENLKIKAGLMKEQQRAMHEFNVISMPAFIVNGNIHQGEITCEKLAGMCGLK
ncbi:hypothetical protein FACS1894122_01430 [Alphaproteobacteria bacterium]|nr:hypothetical protein FACS1894122_01430 [Alphaproteobacteria bacterium]